MPAAKGSTRTPLGPTFCLDISMNLRCLWYTTEFGKSFSLALKDFIRIFSTCFNFFWGRFSKLSSYGLRNWRGFSWYPAFYLVFSIFWSQCFKDSDQVENPKLEEIHILFWSINDKHHPSFQLMIKFIPEEVIHHTYKIIQNIVDF